MNSSLFNGRSSCQYLWSQSYVGIVFVLFRFHAENNIGEQYDDIHILWDYRNFSYCVTVVWRCLRKFEKWKEVNTAAAADTHLKWPFPQMLDFSLHEFKKNETLVVACAKVTKSVWCGTPLKEYFLSHAQLLVFFHQTLLPFFFSKHTFGGCGQRAHLSALVSRMRLIQMLLYRLQMLTFVFRSKVRFLSDDSAQWDWWTTMKIPSDSSWPALEVLMSQLRLNELMTFWRVQVFAHATITVDFLTVF